MPFFFIVSIVLYIFLCISIDSWTSQLPPECPIKLCLKHLGASIVCVSKLFQIPDKNQFQRLESHRIRFSHGNDPTSLVSRFFNFFLMWIVITKLLNRKNSQEYLFWLKLSEDFSHPGREGTVAELRQWQWEHVADAVHTVEDQNVWREGVKDHKASGICL